MMKRKGSVLLQTLVICIVLAYVAVSLTKWTIGRYAASSGSYEGSAAVLDGAGEMGTYLASMDPDNGSLPCRSASSDGSPNAFSYNLSCSNAGNSNAYTIALSKDGKTKDSSFASGGSSNTSGSNSANSNFSGNDRFVIDFGGRTIYDRISRTDFVERTITGDFDRGITGSSTGRTTGGSTGRTVVSGGSTGRLPITRTEINREIMLR